MRYPTFTAPRLFPRYIADPAATPALVFCTVTIAPVLFPKSMPPIATVLLREVAAPTVSVEEKVAAPV